MPRSRKQRQDDNPKISIKRKKPIGIENLKTIEPLTTNQELAFKAYKDNKQLILHGAAAVSYTHLTLPTKA